MSVTAVVVVEGQTQLNDRTSEEAPGWPAGSSAVTPQKYVLPAASGSESVNEVAWVSTAWDHTSDPSSGSVATLSK